MLFLLLRWVILSIITGTIVTSILIAIPAITVTVGITIAIPIVAITLTIITLIGLNTIDNDGNIKLTIFQIFDHTAENALIGHTLTDNEHFYVSKTHQQERICNQAQRRCVDNDIVISFLQQPEELITFLRSNQFSRVRWNRTTSDDIQIRYHRRGLYDILERLFIGKEGSDTNTIAQSELLEKLGFTQIETQQHCLLSIESINGCYVNTIESLTDALHITCNEDSAFRLALGQEFDIGTDRSE